LPPFSCPTGLISITHKVFILKRRSKMVIISIVSYPPEQSKEVTKRFGELPPVPSFMTIKGPYFSGEVGVGVKAIILYEYDQTKTKEAIEYVGTCLGNILGYLVLPILSAFGMRLRRGLK
jgi:hypothetical protein